MDSGESFCTKSSVYFSYHFPNEKIFKLLFFNTKSYSFSPSKPTTKKVYKKNFYLPSPTQNQIVFPLSELKEEEKQLFNKTI